MLEFNILIAGELEIIDSHCILDEERRARVGIAKTLCYHKKYLDDSDLHEGYNTILKQVEQGVLSWRDDLGEKLHSHLDNRVNVIVRDRVSQEGFTRVESKKTSGATKQMQDAGRDQVYYCLEFNLGTCPHSDNHEGRIQGKKVTKFHVCKRCHREGKYKSHREGSNSCPKRS